MSRLFYDRNSVAGLTKETDNILDLFTKTQQKCEAVNEKIATAKKEKVEEVAKLQGEIATLDGLTARNTKLSSKIDQFLNS